MYVHKPIENVKKQALKLEEEEEEEEEEEQPCLRVKMYVCTLSC